GVAHPLRFCFSQRVGKGLHLFCCHPERAQRVEGSLLMPSPLHPRHHRPTPTRPCLCSVVIPSVARDLLFPVILSAAKNLPALWGPPPTKLRSFSRNFSYNPAVRRINQEEAPMKSSALRRTVVCFALLTLATLAVAVPPPAAYHLLKKYPFGAAEGSTREYFDYVFVDSAARRAYLSHGTEVVVVDTDNGALLGKITGMKQVHGIAVAAEFNRGFISDGAQGKLIIFDLKTLKVTGEAKAE